MNKAKTIRLSDLALITDISREAIRSDIARGVIPWDEGFFEEGQQRRFDASHLLALNLRKMLVSQGLTADAAAAPIRNSFTEIRNWVENKQDRRWLENLNLAVFSSYEYERGKGLYWKPSFMVGIPEKLATSFREKIGSFNSRHEQSEVTEYNFFNATVGALRTNVVNFQSAYQLSQNQAASQGFMLQSLGIEKISYETDRSEI